MLNLVYDINLHYLGVRSQESGVRREERGIEGESFLFAGTQRTLAQSANGILLHSDPDMVSYLKLPTPNNLVVMIFVFLYLYQIR
ncbi:MAG: hypothetical protein F6K54_32820 [Okeania sp. SIO3B5]|uniref:hypothetical protein n=1 Tax=Okeania sp. SIO3B5 TaxID=2607811 RepID=UPI0013FE4FBF|nr:hypothetical protein [Okeania sp. SIO3B5]NEO57439.1 hypothetical protein [Okeania sp. SIO3B5]